MKTKSYAFIIIIAVLILQGCHYTSPYRGSLSNHYHTPDINERVYQLGLYQQIQPRETRNRYQDNFQQQKLRHDAEFNDFLRDLSRPDPTIELRNQTRIMQQQLDLQRQLDMQRQQNLFQSRTKIFGN